MTAVRPGDVLAVRSSGLAGRLIRLGAALRDQPDLSNHVAVVHHTDAHGTVWTLEGRPGGVGWRDAKDYLASSWTLTNAAQPKTDVQRERVCDVMLSLIGTAYSWRTIAEDAALAFGLKDIWAQKVNGKPPGEVVCSSLAAYAYDKAGLPAPGPGDYAHVTPGNWDSWILTKGWEHAAH